MMGLCASQDPAFAQIPHAGAEATQRRLAVSLRKQAFCPKDFDVIGLGERASYQARKLIFV